MRRNLPIAGGGALALASALFFGATIPLVQKFGRGVGPLTTAAALYAGAALFSAGRRRSSEAGLRRKDTSRVLVVALLGAAVAPTALAWGLQRTSAVIASLLLNLEALFTVLLSWLIAREPLGRRVLAAVVVMLAGGALLVVRGRSASVEMGWGALAVAAATFAWAMDNVIGRSLADRDPAGVVLAKGSLGAALSGTLAFALHEPRPAVREILGLALCGALGYGASLRLYLRAQRDIGAARTGSIFAAAPFLGAMFAWALGDKTGGGAWTLAAGALCALGAFLHLTERHEHSHLHGAIEHDHRHRHDDGHHDHVHESATGDEEHAHVHRHEGRAHSHPHAPDLHHRHDH